MNTKLVLNSIIFPFIKIIRGKNKFIFDNKSYEYFIHKYSWNTERVVEIPIILDYISQCKIEYCKNYCGNIQSEYCNTSALTDTPRKFKILEFGNVLQQFVPHNYDILDKYSIGKGVIHEDIVDFKPKEKYDLIVSISTLEHVGFNEDVEVVGHGFSFFDNTKIEKCINNIKENCLNIGGKMIFTIPLGYNIGLDNLIFYDKVRFDSLKFLKRISRSNIWKEVTYDDVEYTLDCYGHPFNNANYICVGEYNDNTNVY